MAITHTNRRGQTYYLHAGQTKTGKPKWYFSLKRDGTLADQIPDGFEVYENPDGLVFLRRCLRTLLTPQEIDHVRRGVEEHAKLPPHGFMVDHGKDAITIYLLDDDPTEMLRLLAPRLADSRHVQAEYARRSGSYSAMMRFGLKDPQKRLFVAERFCFLGGIDDWIYLAGPASLATLLRKFTPHLGKESFFELM